MPYFIIVYAASIALVVKYVFLTDAARWSKTLVAGLFGVCVANTFQLVHLGLFGLFLQVGLCLCIILYTLYQKARG